MGTKTPQNDYAMRQEAYRLFQSCSKAADYTIMQWLQKKYGEDAYLGKVMSLRIAFERRK